MRKLKHIKILIENECNLQSLRIGSGYSKNKWKKHTFPTTTKLIKFGKVNKAY